MEIMEVKVNESAYHKWSPRPNGNTTIALNEMVKVFEADSIETDVVQIGNKDIRGCIACGVCYEKGKCVFDDVVNELAPKFEEADGLVIASPDFSRGIRQERIQSILMVRNEERLQAAFTLGA